MSRSVPVLMAALALCGAAQSAWCGPFSRVTTVRAVVPVADLDLRSDADVDMLLKRIEQTANRLCEGPPAVGVLALQISRDGHVCRTKAVAATIAQIDAPRVRARYAELHKPRPFRLAGR